MEPAHENPLVDALGRIFRVVDPKGDFPWSKDKAVNVAAHQVGKPYLPEWPMTNGTDPNIFQPMDKRHYDDGAYSVYHLEVEMAEKIKNKESPLADRFDTFLLDIFNIVGGGILLPGQRVSWNVWPLPPEGVDEEEWRGHAQLWKDSMNIKHEYPDGKSINEREVTYYDGSDYVVNKDIPAIITIVKEFLKDAEKIIEERSGREKAAAFLKDPVVYFILKRLNERTTAHLKETGEN